MKEYFLIIFGCQMNIADAERIETVLKDLNYEKASKMEDADLIIVVACSVRQTAVDRIFGLTPKFPKLKAKTILTGCVLDFDEKKLEDKFDYILNIKDLNNWYKILGDQELCYPKDYLNIYPKRHVNFIAHIPISSGCENFCTYCAVPYTRGPLKCRDYNEIIKEVKEAVLKGAKEIWLLGQNVNDYDYNGIDFPDLLKMVNDVPGNFWIRFTSPHPKNFSKKLINAMVSSRKFGPYLNLPIQSGSDTVLKRMNRPYTYEKYKKLYLDIKKAFKEKRGEDIFVSTDVIIGFSGETEKEFKETEKAFRELKFDMAYINQYSTRPGTYAILKMEDNVLKKDKRLRDKRLNEILNRQISQKNKKYVGKVLDVLVLEKNRGYYIGKSWDYKTVKFKSDKDLIGEFVKIRITKAFNFGLEGELAKLIVVLGTTATGKTDLAIKLAKEFNGEIVSADSRLVYKKMNIGTAKPTDFQGIKHYLIDIKNPEEEYNVALFKKDAEKAIDNILKKGKIPFLVGGTGLYISSIVNNIDFPEIKPDLKLRKELEEKTEEELFEMYKLLDKEGAELIDKKNKRRLVRAIEVAKVRNFFKNTKRKPKFDILELGISVEKEELKKRIEKRVDKMIEEGLEKEVKKLSEKAPILETIGYGEWKEYNNREEVIERIKINTFKFAKRQMTWFKRDKAIKWIKSYTEAKKEIKKFVK
ncbi:MAG: tRNA (adenosine(37)-N6)-dimethylallyltransferase MiaA [Candidatus Pacebacteria bacterium]|nr:tRNA (adenosine(37)-N6)-dimethylallyltransferase MiaA [Candidatus Paceibacterota bacterium]